MNPSDRIISWDELLQHSIPTNLWIMIDNKIYDVTTYLAEHPGGDDILIQYGGLDATARFNKANHSDYAISLRDQRIVGTIENSPMPKEYQEKLNELLQKNKKKYDASTVHTWLEVKKHNQSNDLWIVVNGQVYDVTEFQHEHPGGSSILLNSGGKDSTVKFNEINHSLNAQKQMLTQLVGVVHGNDPDQNQNNDSNTQRRMVLICIGILIAFLYRTVFSNN